MTRAGLTKGNNMILTRKETILAFVQSEGQALNRDICAHILETSPDASEIAVSSSVSTLVNQKKLRGFKSGIRPDGGRGSELTMYILHDGKPDAVIPMEIPDTLLTRAWV